MARRRRHAPDEDRDSAGGATPAALVRSVDDLPAVLDTDIALDIVRRYVEREQARGRRIVVWTSTVFLLVVLTILTLFLTVGVAVVRNARETVARVDAVERRAAAVTARGEGLARRLDDLDRHGRDVRAGLSGVEAARQDESRMFRTDLERFGRWVSARTDQRERSLRDLEARLARMEAELVARERELAEARRSPPAGPERAGAAAASMAVPTPAERLGHAPAPAMDGLRDIAWIDEPAPRPGDAASGRTASTIIAFPNGDRYEGQVANGLLHGWGVYQYRNGDRYEGNFADDTKRGYGVLHYHNGDVYRGEFLANRRHGNGIYVFADGSRYIGPFREGLRHGQGRYIHADGREIVGEFRQGEYQGNAPVVVGPAGQTRPRS